MNTISSRHCMHVHVFTGITSLVLRHSEAMLDFESTMKNLRGNLLIDYKQLGLQYKLYSCEVRMSVTVQCSIL